MTDAPTSLRAGGLRLWEAIDGKYDLRPDELATLEDACRITDMIDALTRVWSDAGCPTITVGSMKQEVIHPLIGEIRTQRMARNGLFRQLKLPDEAGGIEANQQRAAATTKWESRPTRGA